MDLIIATYAGPVVTFIVGLFAFILYKKQQKDDKKAAANMVLLEIQHVEKSVKSVRIALRTDNLNNLEFDVLRNDVWSKYGYLFTRDFDEDELNVLSNFFQNAKLLNEAVKKSRESFNEDVAQIRVNKQRALSELAMATIANPTQDSLTVFPQKAELLDKLYMSLQEKYLYTPVKYTNDAKKYCEDMPMISTSSVGIKLKKIIGKR